MVLRNTVTMVTFLTGLNALHCVKYKYLCPNTTETINCHDWMLIKTQDYLSCRFSYTQGEGVLCPLTPDDNNGRISVLYISSVCGRRQLSILRCPTIPICMINTSPTVTIHLNKY